MSKLGITTTYKDLEHGSREALERSAHMVPDKVCISFKEERITYRQLNEKSECLAAGLEDIGIRKGDRVSMYMSSCLEFYIAFYALQKVGAIIAWANPVYRTQELTFILNNSQAKAIFVQKGKDGFDNFGLVHELRGNLPHLSTSFPWGEAEKECAVEDVL
jgi:acyl-CoA synthetase (AMP-forming)/AMP-acid ligase II